MKKYRVRTEGKNFIVKIDEIPEKLGFFTTRFIEAENEQEAEKKALDLIRNELSGAVLNDRSNPPVMFTEEVIELDSFGDNLTPGSGFTWYSDDETIANE